MNPCHGGLRCWQNEPGNAYTGPISVEPKLPNCEGEDDYGLDFTARLEPAPEAVQGLSTTISLSMLAVAAAVAGFRSRRVSAERKPLRHYLRG